MKNRNIIAFVSLALLTGATYQQFTNPGASVIMWGYDAGDGLGPIARVKQWVGPDGTISFQPPDNLSPSAGRIVLYPRLNDVCDEDARAEYTLYGYSDQSAGHPESAWERMSVSQICNTNERHVRLSIEAGGANTVLTPLWICFDGPKNAGGQRGYCPFRVDPDPAIGVQVCDVNGYCQRLGG